MTNHSATTHITFHLSKANSVILDTYLLMGLLYLLGIIALLKFMALGLLIFLGPSSELTISFSRVSSCHICLKKKQKNAKDEGLRRTQENKRAV